MSRIQILLRPFFYLLYHQFAWAYNFVAAVVSLGHWQGWVQAALPYLNGRVLEIGYGTGHLQQFLCEGNFLSFGLDESSQMAHVARRRLLKNGTFVRISRGYAQNIPFACRVFDSVVATFPSEYIFDPLTLKEILRVLAPGGKLVILPMAWITGKRPLELLMAWFLRITGEAPGKPGPISASLQSRFAQSGFNARSEIVEFKNSQVLVIVVTLSSLLPTVKF